MLDFFRIKERSTKNGVIEVYPDFRVCRSKDLMIRGKSFYAIWDEGTQLWSTDEYDVQRLVDEELDRYVAKLNERNEGSVQVKYMSNFSSGTWREFRNYVGLLSDSASQLDENLTFSNTVVKKSDHVSRRLPYPLSPGDVSAWSELMDVLYLPEERAKIEWAIGAIISGDSKTIQKFLVFYGSAGTGKSTVLNIIQKLFAGYYTMFDAKALTSSNNAFATEAFKSNPLVAIQHDGDLSKIEDNTKLNSIVSHEDMTMNEKYKPSYNATINAFLLMGTNNPVKITDAKSGIIRRLIDVQPTGNKVSPRRYQTLYSQIDFELGAIAHYCLEVYREMGKDFYSGYRPIEMMLQTDVFFNYIEAHYDLFKEQGGVTLQQAFELYKTWSDESELQYKMPRMKLREELKNYFDKFEDRAVIDGVRVRSWYSEFNADRFKAPKVEAKVFSLVMDEHESLIDEEYKDLPAQYANAAGNPKKWWSNDPRRDKKTGEEFIPEPHQVCSTVLSDLDTSKEHFVRIPENHIVIDFDLTDAEGNKSPERNLEAASKWPSTYAEYSKSGGGVHLHYIYEGDVTQLSRVYDDGIEIKVFTGYSALRRRLSLCNNVPIAKISSGLPLQEKKMMNTEVVMNEKRIRDLIGRNLRKEIHPGTKSSIDFIHKILDDAYYAGVPYDVTDLRSKILAFANNSTNQALLAIKTVMDMKFKSEEVDPNPVVSRTPDQEKRDLDNETPVYFDVEVFPNLFIICWKYEDNDNIVRMINPTAQAVEELMNLKLNGFNNRRYDNHILYGAMLGFSNEQLYKLSQRIISNTPGALFGEAYNISYSDIYDYAATKQGLKKWEIQLGLKHKELGLPWDEPVPEELWEEVAEYCDNDVVATEAVAKHLKQDLVARQILADLSGLPVNAPTLSHTAKIIFQGDKPAVAQKKFIYTDLSEMFPGYKFEYKPEKKAVESTYLGEVVGEGGLVRAKPGMYQNVVLLDVASMHPTSIEQLELFGPYTDNFAALKSARMAIKHGDYDSAREMLGGKLAPHLDNTEAAEALSYALKIVINIVYGLTSAKFDNPFRDVRNKDNIVAKRGALFMLDLMEYVKGLGYEVAHIKTDSIKIPLGPLSDNELEKQTKEVVDLVSDFGKKYGYDFEHEATYERMTLVNDAVYIAKYGWAAKKTKIGKWEATGAQFKEPYVFKTLFSKEPIQFRDKCVEKHVQKGLMYLDFDSVGPMHEDTGDLHFVGKAGLFCPMKPGTGGGLLIRKIDEKMLSVQGTKGWLWMESEMVEKLGLQKDIDMDYFRTLVDEAVNQLKKYGDVEGFLDGGYSEELDILPCEEDEKEAV
ncbi:DNA primase/polymerase [Arthrobacter phage Qui]|uniref:DNA primase/polymerase n=1 Tax=Arthrobacter phage Qui TaxID=2603260 RepID=A0A5B8WHT6_9CAUD|nr:DNA primase/polymerase [Arthrobacter phage Qui]QED11599.1 DNA primase/polymerase [Arthrobacter phage Qui]QOC56431.1 DNA primase/polymerase [Arthrobacter phage Paella]